MITSGKGSDRRWNVQESGLRRGAFGGIGIYIEEG